ncbi:hypothetical protein ACI2K4_04870 [Micromonospora sp. NPDC050397]|uniref:hypothetical protein n=1 Tax=Micromonospora sp. NPDC050397 TaxID=3364279 RepID=UPI003850ACCE
MLTWLAAHGWSGATRSLIAHGERGDQVAVDALWMLWYFRPADTVVWDTLTRWRRPDSTYDPVNFSRLALGDSPNDDFVVWEAKRFDHPINDMARRYLATEASDAVVQSFCREVVGAEPEIDRRLVAYCVEHDVTPVDPVQRAGFLLLTRQFDRYQAHDPDGRLVVAYYPPESHPIAERVRQCLVELGDLDRTARLIASRQPVSLLWDEETAEFAAGLVTRAAWAQLWNLLLSRRVDEMMTHLPAFPPDWHPTEPADRDLFARLRALPPDRTMIALNFIRADLDHYPDWTSTAGRPLDDAEPAHLVLAQEALADPAVSDDARAWLEPLVLCLEHRFRS